jgi:PAS domain-containing protein
MIILSQNNKIALSALAIFLVTFASMLFFLGDHDISGSGGADVLNSHGDASDEEMQLVGSSLFVEEMAAVKNSPLPVIITDNELTIHYSRGDFCEFLEISCEEVDGKTLFELVGTDDVVDLASLNLKLVQDGVKIDSIGPYKIGITDEAKLVLLSATPVKDKEDKVFRIIFEIKDITERIEMFKVNEDGETNFSITELLDIPNKG